MTREDKGQHLNALPKQQASIEARKVKYCIQGDGLAMADDKIRRGCYTSKMGAYNMAYYEPQKQELNTSIYLHNNKQGFRYNINHPKINELYRRYKKWQGIPQGDPLSNEQRRDFEKYLDGIFKK